MEARAACRRKRTMVDEPVRELLGDEEGHINFIETQLNLLKISGMKLGQLNAHSADDFP